MFDLLVRDGIIVEGGGSAPGSLAIRDGRVVVRVAVGEDLPNARAVIDAKGRLVIPGIIDPHVHFYGEGIGAYSRLAAIGGVTTFIGMIRDQPEDRLADVAGRYRDEGLKDSLVDFSFHAVLHERAGVLDELSSLGNQGLHSFKMFLAYKNRGIMVSERFLLEAMAEIHQQRGLALLHAEDGEVIDWLERRAQAEDRCASEDYEPTRPATTEAVSVQMASVCAEATGCPLYIVHLSSAAGLEAVLAARRRGVLVWVETCPQYLLLDDTSMREHGVAAKIAPPLRSPADRRALSAGLAAGDINTVGSDHASHTFEAKQVGETNVFAAPFGMPGSPTLWPAMYTWAVDNRVPLSTLVRAIVNGGVKTGHLAA